MVLHPSNASNSDGREMQIHSNNKKKPCPEDFYPNLKQKNKSTKILDRTLLRTWIGYLKPGEQTVVFLILSRKQNNLLLDFFSITSLYGLKNITDT